MRHVAVICVLLMALWSPAGAAESSPNFVIIFVDDMGYGDIGPFGSTKNRTPHLDRMAAEGMKLTGLYAAPVCSPSRAALMTGASSGEITSTMDFLPTFAALAGAELPAGRKIDGGNIAPILRGEAGARTTYEKFFYYQGETLRAVRSGGWKLHVSGELYNLDRDIGEREDVSAANPDVVKKLESYLEEGRRDLGDGDRAGAGVRAEGVVGNPKFLIPRPGKTGAAAHEPIYKGALPRGRKGPATW